MLIFFSIIGSNFDYLTLNKRRNKSCSHTSVVEDCSMQGILSIRTGVEQATRSLSCISRVASGEVPSSATTRTSSPCVPGSPLTPASPRRRSGRPLVQGRLSGRVPRPQESPRHPGRGRRGGPPSISWCSRPERRGAVQRRVASAVARAQPAPGARPCRPRSPPRSPCR